MYLDHFGLTEQPFQLTPDSDFLYMSEAHARAKAYMDYTIWNRDGFVVITGDVGTGKTTLIQKLLSELDDNVIVAKVFQTQLNEVEFLQAVLNEFHIRAFNANKVELLDLLNTFLIERYAESRQLVLIVDEAQNLSHRVLEEIRLLSGLETKKEKMLHVILVGQPELREKLESPELYQLLQRVRLRFHIEALGKEDIEKYIGHRLSIAGGKTEIFEKEAYPVISQYTGGIPRLINTLCDTALTFAYADNEKTVSARVVKNSVKELSWPPYSKRVKRREAAAKAQAQAQAKQETAEAAVVIERRRDIGILNESLDRLDSLLPSLLTIADRMIKIEDKLKTIADRMTPAQRMQRERASTRAEKKS